VWPPLIMTARPLDQLLPPKESPEEIGLELGDTRMLTIKTAAGGPATITGTIASLKRSDFFVRSDRVLS